MKIYEMIDGEEVEIMYMSDEAYIYQNVLEREIYERV